MKSRSKVSVVKIGGNVIDNEQLLASFLNDFSELDGHKILVHGGGKKASEIAKKLGLEPTFVNGRRITDESMLEVAVMTYSGLLNKQIVAQLQQLKTNSIGFSGADGNLILSEKRKNTAIDFGFVGDVIYVNSNLISVLLSQNIVPVFSAITHDGNGQLLNTNADTIATEIAISLSKEYDVELFYSFEKKGVLLDAENEDSVIELLDSEKYNILKEEKIIHSGMLPKLENCFRALASGIHSIAIGNQNILNSKIATRIKL